MDQRKRMHHTPTNHSHSAQFWRDPAMPYVESRRACDSRACYRLHSHPTFSIGAVDAGSSVFTGAPDGPVVLHPGTLVFVPASRAHACNPAEAGWSYQMLHVDAQWLLDVWQEDGQRVPGFAADAAPVRMTRNAAVYARFCALNALLFSEASIRDKEAALIEFMGGFAEDPEQSTLAPADNVTVIDRLMPLLDVLRRTQMDMSLPELAAMVSMSRYQLIRAFRGATGMTPHAWQLNQRINQARLRLQAGDALADIAYDLGFSDQSHFQRVFKAHAGVTPKGYRA
jgi:AraC-like DNA-binding protein